MSLTAERLRELLHYDPLTGLFIRIVRRGKEKIGSTAGRIDSFGHRQIGIDGRRYLAHRLAWLYMTGVWPIDQIDHINGVPDGNQWSNLRQATGSQNQQNLRKAKGNSKSGLLGVCASRGKWMASITCGGKQKHLGYFETPQMAHEAYIAAKFKMHPFQTIATKE